MKLLLPVALALWASAAGADDRPIVAVFDIQAKSITLAPQVLSGLTDYFSARIAASGLYQVIPRDQVKGRLSEQKRDSYRKCYDQSCQIEIGKELAANKAISAQVIRIGKKCVITATIYDLGRAATERAETAEGKCGEDEIMKSIRTVADKLTGTYSYPAEPAPVPGSAPAVAAPLALDLRWPPACPAETPGRCLELARQVAGEGKNHVAFLLAGMAYSRAAGRKEWTTEKDATNFLETLGSRYIPNQADLERILNSACERRDREACLIVAEYYNYNKEGKKAFPLYVKSCNLGHSTGCRDVGNMYNKGTGVPQNQSMAAEFWKKACDANEEWGCYSLATAYLNGQGVSKDPHQSLVLWRRGCDAGVGLSCQMLASLYYTANGVEKNLAKAADLFRRGCDMGTAGACHDLAEFTDAGDGVEKNPAKAADLFQRACDGNVQESCNRLGLKYQMGQGVAQDLAKATDLYRRACEGNVNWGCYNLASMYFDGKGVAQDFAKAVEYYRKACDMKAFESCSALGNRYFNGEGIAMDRQKAFELYQKACDGGAMWGCNNMGNMYRYGTAPGGTNSARAAELYRQACNGGIQDSCNSLNSLGTDAQQGRAP